MSGPSQLSKLTDSMEALRQSTDQSKDELLQLISKIQVTVAETNANVNSLHALIHVSGKEALPTRVSLLESDMRTIQVDMESTKSRRWAIWLCLASSFVTPFVLRKMFGA